MLSQYICTADSFFPSFSLSLTDRPLLPPLLSLHERAVLVDAFHCVHLTGRANGNNSRHGSGGREETGTINTPSSIVICINIFHLLLFFLLDSFSSSSLSSPSFDQQTRERERERDSNCSIVGRSSLVVRLMRVIDPPLVSPLVNR